MADTTSLIAGAPSRSAVTLHNNAAIVNANGEAASANSALLGEGLVSGDAKGIINRGTRIGVAARAGLQALAAIDRVL
jgi:hypothetical protein